MDDKFECKHGLIELMYNYHGTYEFIGLFYCVKCDKIYKKTLQEIKF